MYLAPEMLKIKLNDKNLALMGNTLTINWHLRLYALHQISGLRDPNFLTVYELKFGSVYIVAENVNCAVENVTLVMYILLIL